MNVNKLTLGEIAKVEELAGTGIASFGDDTAPKGKLMAALAFIIKKRTDKDFTFAQALELTEDDLTDLLGVEEDPKEQN